jgi:DNA-binding transcriptional ArsR family regulator
MRNRLATLFSSRVRAELFRLLFGLSDRELHLREIERKSGLSISTVRQDIGQLIDLDLIRDRRDGNRRYCRANKEHPLYGEIHRIVIKTVGLVDVIRDAIGDDKIRAAFVFGSIAQGMPMAESDVDLMVIGSVSFRELSRRLSGAEERVGREINPYVIGAGELSTRLRAKDHFLSNVMDSDKMFIVGSEDELRDMGRTRMAETPHDKRRGDSRSPRNRRSRSGRRGR